MFINSFSIPAIVVSEEGAIQAFNSAAETLSGYEHIECIGIIAIITVPTLEISKKKIQKFFFIFLFFLFFSVLCL